MIPVEFQGALPAPCVPAKLPRVLVWFRRDLRLDDNLALSAALEVAEEVVSFYYGSYAASTKFYFSVSAFPSDILLIAFQTHLCSKCFRYLSTSMHLKKKASSSLDVAPAGGLIPL